jgi:hypothetical protein
MRTVAAKAPTAPPPPATHAALLSALIQQACVAVPALLLLDGLWTARVVGAAVAGFWIAVALVVLPRARRLGPRDIALIRWGFVPALVVAFLAASAWLPRLGVGPGGVLVGPW